VGALEEKRRGGVFPLHGEGVWTFFPGKFLV